MISTVKQKTCARIPTPHGEFQLCYYSNDGDDKEHLALLVGDIAGQEDILVRVHSECFTGDVLGSLRCDCGPQLQNALQLVAQEERGIIIYLRQEGRGIGLLDKLRAYNLQDDGFDTVDANLMLGHQPDERDYTVAALILQDLGVSSLRLLTNNPTKIASLQAHSLVVSERVPLQADMNSENAAYLRTKVERMQHLLSLEDRQMDVNGHYDLVQNTHSPLWQPLHKNEAQRNGRTFVTLSYAQSLDGSITAKRGSHTDLSGEASYAMTHRLRSSHDAILVGIGTVLADDPSLTVRLVEGRDPQPIILDSQLRFPMNARLLANKRKPWIVTTLDADPNKQQNLEEVGVRIFRLPASAQGQVDIQELPLLLASQGIDTVMVEGGAAVITSFLSARIVDRLVLTIVPLWLGGLNAVQRPLPNWKTLQLDDLQYQQVGRDIVVSGNLKSRSLY